MKHVHAEVIHAWADGATIQYTVDGKWHDVHTPAWIEGDKYRVKPDPRATRDMAIAIAVRSACMFGCYTTPGEEGIDLAAIIATVKD